MKKYIKIASSALLCTILIACSDGGSSGGGGQPIPQSRDAVVLGTVTPIPTGYGTTVTAMGVNNNTRLTLNLINYSIQASDGSTLGMAQANTYINTTQCKTIGPDGSCSVSLLSAPQGKNYLLTMVFKEDHTGKVYTLSQIITYVSGIQPVNGFVLPSSSPNISKALHGKATLSVPFVLAQSYSKVTAAIANSPGGIGVSLSCPGGNYAQGSLCTAYIAINNISFQGYSSNYTLILTGDPLASATAKRVGKLGMKAMSGGQAALNFSVTQNTVANLVTSGFNVALTESAESQLIWVVNTGSVDATTVTVTVPTPFTKTNDSCNIVSGGNSCSFTLGVQSESAAAGRVTITYDDTVEAQSLGFNVNFTPNNPLATLDMSLNSGSLIGVPLNITESAFIVVQNAGSVNITGISFSGLPTQFQYQTGGVNACATDGSESLASSESCLLTVTYTPTTVESGTLNVSSTGSYLDADGQPITVNGGPVSIAYSSLNGAALSITPNPFTYSIRADDANFESQTFVVINSGAGTAHNVGFTYPTVTGFTHFTNCGSTLNAGESCTINTQYGPTTAAESSTQDLVVSYQQHIAGPNESASTTLTFEASLAALISITNIVETGGIGSVESGYTFVNAPGSMMTADITYQNLGTESANNFNVALGDLPVGYQLNSGSTTCGVESGTTILTPSESCVVSISAVNPAGLFNPYTITGPINFNLPGWSYVDSATGVNRESSPTYSTIGNTVAVAANLFASVAESYAQSGTESTGYVESVTFTLSSAAANMTPVSVNVQVAAGGAIQSVTGNPCTTLVNVTDTCTVTINYAPFAPSGVQNYQYLVSPTGQTTGIIGYISYTLP